MCKSSQLFLLSIALVSVLFSASSQEAFSPIPVNPRTSSQCSTSQDELDTALNKVSVCTLTNVFDSCQQIFQTCQDSMPSGYYNIRGVNGSVANVYCDMEGTNCDGSGGWMRIANIDMTDDTQSCEGVWTEYSQPQSGVRVCMKASSGCSISYFYAQGVPYTQVCGRVRGYQYGSAEGFRPYLQSGSTGISADGAYLDGVSITYGNPRAHIWSYVSGLYSYATNWNSCPCNTGSRGFFIQYVGDDYYCESAIPSGTWQSTLYATDPLWDGEDCFGAEQGCCQNPKMPWFLKTFDQPIYHDIEVRLCNNEGGQNERITIDIIELYVR